MISSVLDLGANGVQLAGGVAEADLLGDPSGQFPDLSLQPLGALGQLDLVKLLGRGPPGLGAVDGGTGRDRARGKQSGDSWIHKVRSPFKPPMGGQTAAVRRTNDQNGLFLLSSRRHKK